MSELGEWMLPHLDGDKNPWINEAKLVPEREFSPKADKRPKPQQILPEWVLFMLDQQNSMAAARNQWMAWNNMSPEWQFCWYAAYLTRQLQEKDNPVLVVETGLGQGYVTRTVLKALTSKDKLLSYDTDQFWIKLAKEGMGEEDQLELGFGSPGAAMLIAADLVILDSNTDYRGGELDTWILEAEREARLLIHDTFHHETSQGQYTSVIKKAMNDGLLEGEFIDAPRGWFSGVHL